MSDTDSRSHSPQNLTAIVASAQTLRDVIIAIILYLAQKKRGASSQSIRKELHLEAKGIYYNISMMAMRALGFVVKYGQTRGTRYVVTDRAIRWVVEVRPAMREELAVLYPFLWVDGHDE